MQIDRALNYYSFYGKNCGCGQDHGLQMKAWSLRKSIEAIKTIWNEGFKYLEFKDAFFKPYISDKSASYQEQLEKGLNTDSKKLIQAGDQKGYQRFSSMRENVWHFGAGSVREEYSALDKLANILKSEGKDIAEESSQKMLNALSDRYQVEFKKVEDATIEASGLMAKKWQQITQSGKSLKFVTVGDNHVRISHAKLDGIVLPSTDSFWDKHYPPIGYGCRCDVEETNDPDFTGKIPNNIPIPPGLSGNVGKTGIIFTDKHPYMDGQAKELGEKALQADIRLRTEQFAKMELRKDYQLDYNGKPIQVKMVARSIDKMINTSSVDYNLKNESVYSFKDWSKTLAFKGEAPNRDLKGKPLIDKYLYFETEVLNRKMRMSVEVNNAGDHRFYSLNEVKEPSLGTPSDNSLRLP